MVKGLSWMILLIMFRQAQRKTAYIYIYMYNICIYMSSLIKPRKNNFWYLFIRLTKYKPIFFLKNLLLLSQF